MATRKPGPFPPRPWSATDDAILSQMRLSGLPFLAIAAALGRSKRACESRAIKLGISAPPGANRNNRIAALQNIDVDAKRKGFLQFLNSERGRTIQREKALKAKPWLYNNHRLSPESRKKGRDIGRKLRWERYYGSIPLHLREHFKSLKSKKGYSDAEARAIIAEEWRSQLRRALSAIAAVARDNAPLKKKMTPFERQLERVRNGAKLVPTLKLNRTHDFSLTGNSSGMF